MDFDKIVGRYPGERYQAHLGLLFHCFLEKIRHDVSSESSARLRIHMKKSNLFSSKGESKKLKCRLLQFLFGALMVNLSKLQNVP